MIGLNLCEYLFICMMQEYDPCVNRDHTVPPFWRNMLLPFFGMRFDVQDRCMEKKYRNGVS